MADVSSFPHQTESASAPAGVTEAERNVGHGHVFPRPDGRRARCGGPGLCRECSQEAVLRAGADQDRRESIAAALGLLQGLCSLLRDNEPVRRGVLLEHLEKALQDLDKQYVVPVREEPAPAKDLRVHSRACGIHEHSHGPSCAPDCPTCGGRLL